MKTGPDQTNSSEIVFLLEGLHCPNCAAAIEKAVEGLNGVIGSSLDPVSAKLFVKVQEGQHGEDLVEPIRAIVERIEPGVSVSSDPGLSRDIFSPAVRSAIKGFFIRIAPGVALWIAAILLPLPPMAQKILFFAAYLLSGWGVLLRAAKNTLKGRVFDEYFLMSLATLGAFAIGEYSEAVAVMIFFRTGEALEEVAVARARGSIMSLVDIMPDTANLLRDDGTSRQVPSRSVKPGDHIMIKPGERIPLDGEVAEGLSSIDTSSITGESMPRDAAPGDPVLAGFLNHTGTLDVRVTKPFSLSAASRILKAIEDSRSQKARSERFVTSFSRYYTPAVVFLAAAIAVIPPLAGKGTFDDWIYRALVFLVVSCPCALLLSIPLGVFAGIGAASRRGILIKGGDVLERLNRVGTVLFDKTGTLTSGSFQVTGIFPSPGQTRESLLRLAAIAEQNSNHPLALAVKKAWDGRPLPPVTAGTTEFPGLGVITEDPGGRILAGNHRFMEQNNIKAPASGSSGTAVHIALGGDHAGFIVVADTLKPDAFRAIKDIRALGVEKIFLLSGDRDAPTGEISKTLGLDGFFSGLLPEEKKARLESIIGRSPRNGNLLFVGDGLNDAPAITRADVGVSMGKVASDVSIENADVVILNDEPSKLAEAIRISKRTRTIVWQNIALALGTKVAVLSLGALGIATLWEAVFADVGVALLAVLNSSRALSVKKQAVTDQAHP